MIPKSQQSGPAEIASIGPINTRRDRGGTAADTGLQRLCPVFHSIVTIAANNNQSVADSRRSPNIHPLMTDITLPAV